LKNDGSKTGLAIAFFFVIPMPDGVGEEEDVPSGDANTMDAMFAIRCAFRFVIRLVIRRASILESSAMSMPLTGDGVRHRYMSDLSESAVHGETPEVPPSSSSSEA
jgi:hypothetical protein